MEIKDDGGQEREVKEAAEPGRRQRIADLHDRYKKVMHAVQSGVASEMQFAPSATTPKHLRVGVNSALIETGAISQLLLDKEIITEEEYLTSIVEFAEREKASYEEILTKHYGKPITLY